MLDVVGVKSLEQLYQGLESLFVKDMDLPAGKSQQEVARYFENLSADVIRGHSLLLVD